MPNAPGWDRAKKPSWLPSSAVVFRFALPGESLFQSLDRQPGEKKPKKLAPASELGVPTRLCWGPSLPPYCVRSRLALLFGSGERREKADCKLLESRISLAPDFLTAKALVFAPRLADSKIAQERGR